MSTPPADEGMPFVVALAVAKFRLVEYERLKLARAEETLTRALEGMGAADAYAVNRYFEATEPIRVENDERIAAITARTEARAEARQARRRDLTPLPPIPGHISDHHTVDGPADCARCQLLRDNADWIAPDPRAEQVTVQTQTPDGANDVITLTAGQEYVIRHRLEGIERYDRESRMGFIGTGPGGSLLFSARGPARTHGGQYGGTQTFQPRWIRAARRVEPDHAARYLNRRAPAQVTR